MRHRTTIMPLPHAAHPCGPLARTTGVGPTASLRVSFMFSTEEGLTERQNPLPSSLS